MKRCPKCKTKKSRSEFWARKSRQDGLQAWCQSCSARGKNRAYRKNPQHYKDRVTTARHAVRTKLLEYLLDHPCKKCGEDDPIVLDFDHVNRASKEVAISNMIRGGFAWERILAEIKKCQVLCANCHRRKTARESNSFKWRSKHCGDVPVLQTGE